MNLGDGLLFELDNGKPRLILLNHGVEKNPAKVSVRPIAASILSPRQPSRLEDINGDQATTRSLAGRHREVKCMAKAAVAFSIPTTTEGKNTLTLSKTFNHPKDNNVKVGTKVKSHKPKSKNDLLRSIKKVEQPQSGEQSSVKDAVSDGDANPKDLVCLTNTQLQQLISSVRTSSDGQHASENQKPQNTSEDNKRDPEIDSSAKKEKDEDKKKEAEGTDVTSSSQEKDKGLSPCLFSWLEERKSDSKSSIDARRAQWRSELDAQVALKQQQQQRLAPNKLQAEEYAESVLSVQSSVSHREQPAAIRSSLKLGEVTPIEDVMRVERKEEQRRLWLEQLDRQKEEARERRKREKLLQNQVEDHEHWATHFDSMQRRPGVQPAALPAPPPGPLSRSEKGESSLSLAWDGSSSCGAESIVGTSVDSTSGYPRTSFLRTMTSLLDPVQIEERERRRHKQLEQQRVIKAQMEERKKQKQQAEAKRRQEEIEEERRVALEREMLQRQYKLETQKTKQLDRDHDDSRHQETSEPSKTRQPKSSEANCSPSLYKDTAVQTEAVSLFPLKAEELQTADVPASSRAAAPVIIKSRATRTEKENICLPAGDSNEPHKKTEKGKREKRRPEWNTQRPIRRFVPASERYPVALQKNRQESRLKRQAELLALQERTRLTRTEVSAARNQEIPLCPNNLPTKTNSNKKLESGFKAQSSTTSNTDRGRLPAVPGAQHRVQSQQSSTTPPHPPVMEFIPYVRTDEVFNLDPLEPADTPPPHTHSGVLPKSSPPARLDPLHHPELQRNTHTQQQQEILRGLAQLRQGLLQKQKELETDLSRHGNEQRLTSTAHRM